jgi:hypothetical protein
MAKPTSENFSTDELKAVMIKNDIVNDKDE